MCTLEASCMYCRIAFLTGSCALIYKSAYYLLMQASIHQYTVGWTVPCEGWALSIDSLWSHLTKKPEPVLHFLPLSVNCTFHFEMNLILKEVMTAAQRVDTKRSLFLNRINRTHEHQFCSTFVTAIILCYNLYTLMWQ